MYNRRCSKLIELFQLSEEIHVIKDSSLVLDMSEIREAQRLGFIFFSISLATTIFDFGSKSQTLGEDKV
ncbi:unnamed protein product [Lactuca virosa]|uniref:Uncharacterized protein n=1 Tax=Lactuca virosa TaxID=75947 RepID=A0AAU9MCV8_9ASTR|nr:unnamed protein product [Lactuca virosa]